ncbi:MAG TPA: class I SAM-dependent methyltransferase [Candidatus Sulfotelmatobacter sp.]|nr:class I SAM-dependent methyltransferase [Candidatus Sulfotelmatobacter sp.]
MKIQDEKAHVEQVRRFYAAIADGYEENIRRFPYFLNVYQQYERALADVFERKNGAGTYHTVVEMGAGTGAQTLYLARHAKRVVSLDLSEDLLRINREKLRQARITNVQLLTGDITRSGLRAGIADCVISLGDVFSHIAPYERALQEMARVTKPGGILCFDFDNKWYPQLLWDWAELRRAAATPGEGHVRTWRYQGHSVDLTTFTHKEMRGLLAKYGFHIQRTYGFDFFTYLAPEPCHFSEMRTLGPKFCYAMGWVDRKLTRLFPVNRLAENKIIIARRVGNGAG